MALIRAALVTATLLICISSARAQVPDSLVRFDGFQRGEALTDSLPAKLPHLTLLDLASQTPGSFTYAFGAAGWPDAISLYSLPPRATTVVFNELPFTHLFTGRPADDLVPLAFVDPPRLELNRHGHAAALSARLRDFDSPRPLTEGRYWKGGEGLQSIDVVHVQNRRRVLFGRPGLLNILGAYSGRAATGEYPGSNLRRGRQLHMRARYAQRSWSLEILNVHNRRRIGAHGGVIPEADDFNTIYIRTGARVENEEAVRRLIRNDLTASFRFGAPGAVTAVSGFWTAETFRYRDPEDTLTTTSGRFGARAARPLFGITAHLEAWLDAISHPGGRDTRETVHAWIGDSLHVLGWRGDATAGAHFAGGSVFPGASLRASRSFGSISGRLSALLSGDPPAAIDEVGFGLLRGLSEIGPGRVVLVETGVGYSRGALDGFVGAYFSRTDDLLDYYVLSLDSAAVMKASSSFVRAGVYADIGWRRSAERGFYFSLKPTISHFLNPDESSLHRRSADALPSVFGKGRLGMRYLMFRGDLDLDAYVEVSAWSSFRSRTLHPQSGLLVLPSQGARLFGPSSNVDIVMEAGIREAKVFVMYRNALSGTALMPGNLIVPNYPLPAQEFRIGVYWPILD